jgi:hypothetical protein
MKAMLPLALSACVITTSTIQQGLCTVDEPGCVTPWSLVNATRERYGSPTGKVACSPISSTQGINYTSCTVSAGSVTLFSCTFSYYVDEDGESSIQSIDCQ